MIRSTCALVLIVAGALALAACGKKDDTGGSSGTAAATDAPAASAAPTASAADVASAAPPADTSSAATSASAPPPDAPPPVAGGPVRGIDDCCAALASAAVMSRSRSKRGRADKAAEICPGIAAQVRAGRASRATALTQIRSAFATAGGQVPSACR